MHKFAQSFPTISIDAPEHTDYLARQIEPGSFRTLRLSSKRRNCLTAVAQRDLNRKLQALRLARQARQASRRVDVVKPNRQAKTLRFQFKRAHQPSQVGAPLIFEPLSVLGTWHMRARAELYRLLGL
jgi:hypothetical protein